MFFFPQLNGKFWFGDPQTGEKFGRILKDPKKNVQDPLHFYNQVPTFSMIMIINFFFIIMTIMIIIVSSTITKLLFNAFSIY